MSALVAVAALAGALLLFGRPTRRVPVDASRTRWTLAPWVIAAGALAAAAWVDRLALGLVLTCAAAGVRALLARQRASRLAAARSDRVAELCEAMAADLAAGLPTQQVLVRCAGEFPEFVALAGAAEMAADVPDTLRRLGLTPGCGELRLVAAAWQVAHRTGAGMADALERAAHGVRERRRTDRLVAAELASAHATARIMAVLPVLFTVAGSGLGADPLGFLTGGAGGLVCLAAGLALTFAGLLWLQRMSDAVSRR
ncbi:MAG: type secretion system protein [Nocardioidaceae bacterium]|nr:type secretion system protein [Nocardioidaceae bacterium]